MVLVGKKRDNNPAVTPNSVYICETDPYCHKQKESVIVGWCVRDSEEEKDELEDSKTAGDQLKEMFP